MMKTILVCGLNPSWQKTLHFRSMIPGEVNRAYALEQTASGKGINFCRAARQWGAARTRLLQFAGGDTGKMLTEVLDREGISHTTLFSPAVTRTCSTVISENPHSVTELIEPSEPISFETSGELYRTAVQSLELADALAVCGTFPPGVQPDFYAGLIGHAAQLHKFILLDSFMNVEDSLKQGVSMLKVNKMEILKLTGQTELAEAFRFCRETYGLKLAAVTDGPESAWFFDGEKIWKLAVPSIPRALNPISHAIASFRPFWSIPRALNPIGAGDTCSAVTCSEIMKGTVPLEAFQLGLCAATASCLTPSAAEYDAEQARNFRSTVPEPQMIQCI